MNAAIHVALVTGAVIVAFNLALAAFIVFAEVRQARRARRWERQGFCEYRSPFIFSA